MPSEEKKDSLLYSLFNRSKREDNSEVQLKQDTKEIEQITEEILLPQSERVEIKGVWEPLTPDLKGDVRAQLIRLWVRPDKMQAKVERVRYVPEPPCLEAEPTAQELEEAEKKALEFQQKIDALQKKLDDSTNMSAFERVSTQQELSALKAGASAQQDEPNISQYEWNEVFVHLSLTSVGIKYGIKEEVIEKLLLPTYDEEMIIAKGLPQIDGIDGYIHEFYPRDAAPSFETRPDGSIDFKNMHLVTNIKKDTVIAELIPPTQGTPGNNVFGTQINPRNGASKILARGENTDLVKNAENPEIQNLVAKIDGNLIFKNDKFAVENIYKVNGNVDNSTGNINFIGNVIVSGDVLEGYEIRTPGSITVFGMVEGASLYAGDSIHLEKGINGMMKGILEAGNEITAKFIENCKVRAGGSINSESIINSKVECDADIKVIGKGLISGGKITAFGSIEAKVLGSRKSTPTTIILGITPSIIRERNELEESYKVACYEYEEIRKNISYLEGLKLMGNKELERERNLVKLNGAQSISILKKQRLEVRREIVIEEMRNVSTCTFSCDTAFPPARITIGNANYMLKETMERCRFYRNADGEVSVGMK